MFALEALSVLLATSPWAPAEWKIHLNFGREKETPSWSVDPEWGISGARLAISLPVLVESESDTVTEDSYLGGRCNRLRVLEDSSFVSVNGQESIRFEEAAAWRMNARPSRSVGDASTIRMVLDLKDRLSRNDIVVEPQRLYLAANVWRENELDVAKRRIKGIRQDHQLAQDLLDAQLSHESGDRRLDGTNILDTAAASIDMAALVKRRDDSLIDLRQAQQTLPYRALSNVGDWPGSDEGLAIQEGSIALQRKTRLFGSDELVIVGRWTATPVETAMDTEYYEDDSDREHDFESMEVDAVTEI